jgi:magnesium transporter
VAGAEPVTEHRAQGASLAISPVGRRAAHDYWWAGADETCAAALDRLRATAAKTAAVPVHHCYVIDDAGLLIGYAPMAVVLGAPSESRLRDCMNPRVIPIPEGAPEEAIQDFFITYGHHAFPVVDRVGKLVGVVCVEHFSDLVFEGFEAQVREETYRSMGLTSRDYDEASIAAAVRVRLPWLGVALGGGFIAALLLGQSGLSVTAIAALAVFLPLCTTLAERVTLRTFSLRAAWPIGDRQVGDLARREMGATLLIALALAPVSGGLVYIWQGHWRTALVIAGAVLAILMLGAGIGLLLAGGERSTGRNARVLAPLALALADVGAVAVVLVLAHLLMAQGLP